MNDVSPVDESLFASLAPPRLLGSRCEECGTVVFPTAKSCPRCSRAGMAPHPLADRGTVWSWTVQTFCPKPPYVPPAGGFAPFSVGYVDLGDVIIEAHLLVDGPQLEIGLPVRLALETVVTADACELVTYAFTPDGDAS